MNLREKISKVYHPFLDSQLLNVEIPRESLADCENCHLCANSRLTLYNTKCCTYHPVIPNFMVGAILSDERPSMIEGNKRIHALILNKNGINPVGIMPSKEYHLKLETHTKANQENPIQLANAAICPFLHEKRCSIWDYRTELCSTYFCTSVAGSKGTKFWEILNSHLIASDRAIADYCLKKMGYHMTQSVLEMFDSRRCRSDIGDKGLNQGLYNKIWNGWVDREKDFYMDCYQILKDSNPQKLRQILTSTATVGNEKTIAQAALFNKFVFPENLTFHKKATTKFHTTDHHVTISDGKFELKVAKLQFLFINMFDGNIPTTTIIKKARNVRVNIIKVLEKLIEAGLILKNG